MTKAGLYFWNAWDGSRKVASFDEVGCIHEDLKPFFVTALAYNYAPYGASRIWRYSVKRKKWLANHTMFFSPKSFTLVGTGSFTKMYKRK